MSTRFANFLSPGVRVVESDAGYRTNELASFATTYMFGSGSTGATLTPTLVDSLAKFEETFGNSGSENSVKLFFRNYNAGILYFVRVPIAPQFTAVVDAPAGNDEDYTVTITVNGGTPTAVTATVDLADGAAGAAAALISAINLALGASVTASVGGDTDEVVIRVDNPAHTLAVADTTGNTTSASTTPATPNSVDYVYAIEQAFEYEEEWAAGFLIAPEAFQTITNATQRLAVGSAMETLAANRDWMAIVDCAAASDTVAELQADSAQYTTNKGHLAFYAPYLVDLEGNNVPPSPAVAAIACKRYAPEGFQEPIGGKRYKVDGVTDVVYRFTTTQQDTLNPIGCNLFRYFRKNGIVIWGMRTRSSDSLYRFVHTRIIMNVLNNTLRDSFDQYPFSAIDGLGVLLHRIEETAISICRQLFRGGALFGGTEQDAFECECSFLNNTAEDLENGNVLLSVYVAPVPGLEKLLIASYRVPIGQVQQAAAQGRFIVQA